MASTLGCAQNGQNGHFRRNQTIERNSEQTDFAEEYDERSITHQL